MDEFERRLRTEVTRRADELQPAGDLPERITARVARRRRQQRLRTGALATGVAVLAVVAALSRPGGGPDTVETADDHDPAVTTQTTRPGGTDTTSTLRSDTTSTTATSDGTTGTADTTDTTAGTTGTTVGTDEPSGTAPTSTVGTSTTTTTTPRQLEPPDSPQPAAGTCGRADSTVVEVTLNPDIPSPRCVQVDPDQSLRVRNNTDQQVDVSFAHHAATLAPGGAQAFAQPFGDYLEPGVHRVDTNLYGGSGPEIWLAP